MTYLQSWTKDFAKKKKSGQIGQDQKTLIYLFV